jgi:L-amino acid N-acyltransferase YncA
MGFERWGFLPGVGRLEERKADLVIIGRRLGSA